MIQADIILDAKGLACPMPIVKTRKMMKELKEGWVMDVREEAEYAFSHIPGALSVPLGRFDEHIPYMNKSSVYFIICRSGNRSNMACWKLAALGFEHVTNVVPGMSAWNGETENTTGGITS